MDNISGAEEKFFCFHGNNIHSSPFFHEPWLLSIFRKIETWVTRNGKAQCSKFSSKYLYSVLHPLALKIFKVMLFVCWADGVSIKHLVLFRMRSLI